MNAAMVDLREYGEFMYRVVSDSTIKITTDYSIDASSMMAAPQRRTAWASRHRLLDATKNQRAGVDGSPCHAN